MNIITDLIPAGKGIRTGKKLTKCLGLVVHWIGVNQPRAEVIRTNFEREECGTHYVIDWNDGHIIHCVPEDEVCYHVGGSSYTALKRELVGLNNPNWYFVGIECCIDPADKPPADYGAAGKYMDLGKPSAAQYAALVEFAADFLTRHGMTTDNLYRHYDITGKRCHVWFVKDAARWEKFKADVAEKMKGVSGMTEEIKALVASVVKETVAKELAERDAAQAATADRLSPWAKADWAEAKRLGLMDGTRPGGSVTREQLAAVAVRLCKMREDTYHG